jgi:NTE family protein
MTNERPRVGLALAGGVVRAPIHAGALIVLKEAGIPVDLVAGASFGALAGALYCVGQSVAQMEAMTQDLRWSNALQLHWPRLGLFSMERLERFLIEKLGDLTFADLPTPLAVVSADLVTGEQVVLREGRLAPALRASCSLPGLFEPAALDGRLLVDGAVCNNLPITVARALGADYVIAIDARPRAGHRPRNAVSAFLSSMSAMVRNAADDPNLSDVYICPTVERTGGLSMPKPEPLVALGRAAALEALPKIRAALGLG